MANAAAGRPRDPKAYRPIRAQGSREWLVQSSTHKEVDYRVTRKTPHGTAFECTCPWGQNQMELTGRDCRHVKAVKQWIGLLPRDPVETYALPAPVVDPDDGDPWACENTPQSPQDDRSGPRVGATMDERLAGIKAFWAANRRAAP